MEENVMVMNVKHVLVNLRPSMKSDDVIGKNIKK